MKSISAFRRACTAALIAAVQVFIGVYASAAIVAVQSGEYFSGSLRGGAVHTFPIDFDDNGEVDFALYVVDSEAGAFALGPGSGVFGVPDLNPADVGSLGQWVSFGAHISIYEQPWLTYAADWFEDDIVPGFGRAGSAFYGEATRGLIGVPINEQKIIAGLWRPGNRRAAGVRFIGNDGQYHYGWIDLKLESSFSMTIYGWAYETEPGVFVTPYAIPEPCTISCLVMSLFLVRRKRTHA